MPCCDLHHSQRVVPEISGRSHCRYPRGKTATHGVAHPLESAGVFLASITPVRPISGVTVGAGGHLPADFRSEAAGLFAGHPSAVCNRTVGQSRSLKMHNSQTSLSCWALKNSRNGRETLRLNWSTGMCCLPHRRRENHSQKMRIPQRSFGGRVPLWLSN